MDICTCLCDDFTFEWAEGKIVKNDMEALPVNIFIVYSNVYLQNLAVLKC